MQIQNLATINYYVHNSTDFHQILHVAHKCGRVDAYCLRDKPEGVCADFRGVRIPILAVFSLWWPHFLTDQHQICLLYTSDAADE